jgi:hypothetical protein
MPGKFRNYFTSHRFISEHLDTTSLGSLKPATKKTLGKPAWQNISEFQTLIRPE